MSYNMSKFIAEVSEEKTNTVDDSLFYRTNEPSIADFIISGIKVIESLESIKLVRYKHITDASQIDVKLNRRHIKDRELIKDREITKLVDIKDTAQEMLQMEFLIQYDDERRYIKKNLLIPAYIDKYHLLINGNVVLPQKQIVDMSTYTQGKSVKLKTTLTPIDLYKEKIKSPFVATDKSEFYIDTFILNLFTKTLNPLVYYFARFGLHKTINYFSFSDIIDVTDTEYNTDINYYFPVTSEKKTKKLSDKLKDSQDDNKKKMFIEVDKRFFNKSSFTKTFTYMIYDIISTRNPKMKDLDDIEYWLGKLGSLYTTNSKNFVSKGKNVLISFGRILDDITKNTLRLDKKNLKSTYSLVRWLITNYDDLRRKDNHDLELKRVRCNEVTAFYFIQSMAQRINNLLNKKKLSIEAIERIFNWGPEELFKLILSNKNNLLKYDPDINCFDLLNALRYSLLGAQGIKGGKNIGNAFRDIYPSHIGRIDLNGVSHGKN